MIKCKKVFECVLLLISLIFDDKNCLLKDNLTIVLADKVEGNIEDDKVLDEWEMFCWTRFHHHTSLSSCHCLVFNGNGMGRGIGRRRIVTYSFQRDDLRF